jgi:hypothetical protein
MLNYLKCEDTLNYRGIVPHSLAYVNGRFWPAGDLRCGDTHRDGHDVTEVPVDSAAPAPIDWRTEVVNDTLFGIAWLRAPDGIRPVAS